MKDNDLADAICSLTCAVIALGDLIRHQNNNQAVLCRIAEMENKIMSAISDYAGEVNKSFDQIDAGVESLTKIELGIADDVTHLKEVIDKLQTNPGPISPEDQKLLDAAQVRANAAATKLTAAKTALEAIDAATERPVTPPVEPEA